ncbi:MAG: signal peptidase I [Microbacterium sp.]|nr:MAG: signal peptidase I [Microbacterium sp.]
MASTEPQAPSHDDTARRPGRLSGFFSALGRGLIAALLVVILGIGAAVIVVPAVTGSTALTVLTSSMEPHLPPGTMVVVRPTDAADIEPGMVMTYQLESGKPLLITHRVIQRLTTADGEYLFITQGDANPQPDADPVREVQIRGTVWYAIPYIGWAATAVGGDLRSILVTIAIIGLFGYAAWMFGSALVQRARKKSPADDDADPLTPTEEAPQ